MKLKFTLQREGGPVDLVATVDAATTAGELAAYLVASDPSRPTGPAGDGEVTLGIVGQQHSTLDPRQPLAESALQSGSSVTISRSGVALVDPQRSAAAIVTVLEGPDEGKEFPVPAGSSVIGRESGCEVQLSDELASRRHARLNVGESVEIIDLGSSNGILIDDIAVPRSVLRSTDVVQIGDSRISVRVVRSASSELMGTGASSVGFVRSPRLQTSYVGRQFEAPEPPERPRGQRLPVVSLFVPLLMGAVLYFVTKNANSLIFVALSPLMLVGNTVEGRLSRRSAYKQSLAAFNEDVASLIGDLQKAAVTEVTVRLAENPSAADCSAAIATRSALLWSRRPDHEAFGDLRLGLGSCPSRSSIEYPRLKRSIRALHEELLRRTEPLSFVEGVPVVATLGRSALGVVGARQHALDVARGLLLQAVALHSPADLAVGVIVSSRSTDAWDWLKWLPHSTSSHIPLAGRLLAASPGAAAQLVSEVEELLVRRSVDRERGSVPSLLLAVESDAAVEHGRLVALAEQGPARGIFVLWIGDELTSIPAACQTFLEIGRDGVAGTAGYVHDGTEVTPIVVEGVPLGEASRLARLLAPVVDLAVRSEDASDLPRAVPFLALTGSELARSADVVLERWSENRSILTGPHAPAKPAKHAGSLRAVLGMTGSDVHALDLRTDGPHALVGRTTGAGKSELLQSWILGMAAAHSPQRVTFLLVDYKGGSAFRDCVDLPHTVGLVTDLSPHLVRRALASLSAELRYREHLLASHSAKDLVSLEKQGVIDAPPALVIVVDEFAALVSEVPEFVDGVVNVAQRGRSLGLHLILATQRPAGVIKDNLRANTNLRLALRMADEADSSDVLGSKDAAYFDPAVPGRAVSKTGPGRLVPFQTAYAGGWTSDAPAAPELLVEELGFGSAPPWTVPEPAEGVVADPGPTDIRRVVDRIGEAAIEAKIPEPRKPWLPELLAVYDLADRSKVPSRRVDSELVFGIGDSPDDQSQPTVAFNPDRDGNLAVYGTGGSGKSALLRTIAIAAGFTVRGGRSTVYGIDFGGRGLAMLEDLPHVGSVVQGSDHERITRLLRWLRDLIDERAKRYSEFNAGTVTAYRKLAKAPDEERIFLLVDGIAAFRSAYEGVDRMRWFDTFTSIAAEGRPVGVHVVLSSDQRSGLPTTLASAVQSRVVLRMANVEDYGMLGIPSDVIAPTAVPGRGVMRGCEIQVAVLGGDADPVTQAVAVRSFGDAMRRNGIPEAEPIRSLPQEVSLTSLPAKVRKLPVLGLSSDTLGPLVFEPVGAFLVSGPPGSGRTTALHSLASAWRRADETVALHYFGNGRSPLAGLKLWDGSSVLADAADVAAALQAKAAAGPPIGVFIENLGDFVGSPADGPLQALAKVVLQQGGFLVADGETSTLSGTLGLLGAIKASRAGLALSPESSDGNSLYRTSFPRMTAADRLPGRGLLVRKGRTEVVQVALPPTR